MSNVAKVFSNGRSQAVRLPAAFRFDTAEVYIRRDEATGDVILSRKPASWNGFLTSLEGLEVPDSFLGAEERSTGPHDRDPFADLSE